MRDKQQVINQLKRQQEQLEKLPNLNTATLLLSCSQGCLYEELKEYTKPYRFGNFEFSVYGHDTGIDYKISVVAPDDTTLVVRHVNFSYVFNCTVHTNLLGAWDAHIEKALEKFRELQEVHISNRIKELEELRDTFNNEEKALKDKFEAVFK